MLVYADLEASTLSAPLHILLCSDHKLPVFALLYCSSNIIVN